MGAKDGSIIAAVIATHIPTNEAAESTQVCHGIGIHTIDIVQPPGIGIARIADIDAQQTIVTAAPAAKSSAQRPMKAREDVRSQAEPAALPQQIRGSKWLAREVM